jgi:hypothetical protein
MNVEELKKIITDQKEEINEIFEKEKIIDRCVPNEKLANVLKYPNILAILGVRRSGKSIYSTLFLKGKNYGYLNFDDERIAGIEARELNLFLQAFYELYGTDLEYLILDEIQNVDKWELFANRLRRTKKVILTGSNAKLLSGELATHLTGRYIDFTIYPFSFGEFLEIKGIKVKKEDFYSTKRTAEIKKEIREYLSLGGFPEVHKFGKPILIKIYEDIIQKDILLRYKIKNKRAFREIAKYLISNFSDEITFTKLKNITSIKNVHTVKNYVDYLSTAYLTFILERFSFKLKKQTIAPKKVYCIDTGIINSVAFRISENWGAIMENLVAIELLRRKSYWQPDLEIYYWKDRQQREVDFVLKEGLKVKQLIQVTYSSDRDEIERREIKSLLKSSEELKCKDLLIITWDYEDEIYINDTKIRCLPLWKWLLSL